MVLIFCLNRDLLDCYDFLDGRRSIVYHLADPLNHENPGSDDILQNSCHSVSSVKMAGENGLASYFVID